MVVKAEIVSKDTIKPSSPTPHHLRDFKISLLDQLAPPSFYVPVLLFYSAITDFKTVSNKLKASLSDVLTIYYHFVEDPKVREYSTWCVLLTQDRRRFHSSIVPQRLGHNIKATS
ncbi:hypothetical protein VNO77_08612 [Canavalia gladiata]|uniref:Uncharacterized protein n=1 Tax=Canavalia gladiata TaxID=3824 RepID=A0AAN9R136_CANGL